MMETSSARQIFFARFVRMARSAVQHVPVARRPLILLTGGLRSAESVESALGYGHADLLGLARSAVLCPDLPKRLTNASTSSVPFASYPNLAYRSSHMLSRVLHATGVLPLPKLIGAGVGMAWYVVMMRRLAQGLAPDHSVGGAGAVVQMWAGELRMLLALVVLLGMVMWGSMTSVG
jgi:hypothetical protein